MSAASSTTHFPVIVVGGGQAGLSMSYYLRAQGISHVIFERNRIAHAWATQRWDSFCLVTPNWQCKLPGFPYAGRDPHGFMLKDDIVRYVEDYAKLIEAPVREGVAVRHVAKTETGCFAVETSAGAFTADAVVFAVSGYHVPADPAHR